MLAVLASCSPSWLPVRRPVRRPGSSPRRVKGEIHIHVHLSAALATQIDTRSSSLHAVHRITGLSGWNTTIHSPGPTRKPNRLALCLWRHSLSLTHPNQKTNSRTTSLHGWNDAANHISLSGWNTARLSPDPLAIPIAQSVARRSLSGVGDAGAREGMGP